MGLASSQARLLLLTARKSDLEFKAQRITQSEMILALQTEEIAREYSLKISNQTLKYINPADSTETEITAATLTTLTAANGSGMKLQVLDGNGNFQDWVSDGSSKITGYRDASDNFITVAQYNKLSAIDKSQYKAVTSNNNYTGPQILEGINGGKMRIVFTGNDKVVDAVNGTNFSVAYNTKDDAVADAEYRRKTASLQIKEKRLQMDLTQVETQQKACDTEMDSVKKIMDKNIERTFKVFS